MQYKAVIFDLDDTLFDRNAAQIKVVEVIAERLPQISHGRSMERLIEAFMESDRLSFVDYQAGAPSDGLRERRSGYFLEILGVKGDYVDIITEIYVRDYPTANIPIDGAVPLVMEISKTYPVAVVSNGLPDVQYKKIEAIGLREVFACVVLSEEIGIRKPDSQIFCYTADLLHVQPSDCLYVGDSYINDIVGAKTAGMQACWFNRESIESDNMNIQADFVITNLIELNRILGL